MCAEYYKRKNYSILLILIFEKNISYEMFFVNEVLPSKFLTLLEYV